MTDGPASWGARAAALTIDVFFGAAVIVVVAMTAWTAPLQGPLWWACVVLTAVIGLLVMGNRWVLPVRTGWTVGRAAMVLPPIPAG